jgi:hypothetical protein
LYSALPKEIKTEVRKGREKKRMKAKLGAIFLVSTLAIAGAGAAYALWFEDLYIYTDIHTGTVDVEWSVIGYEDTEAPEKDTSYGGMDIDGNDLWLWVYNAYPCIDYYWWFDVHCIGTIPVHFDGFYIQDTSTLDLAWTDDFEILIDRTVDANDQVIEVFDPPTPIWNIQLHEGEYAIGFLHLHFNNDLPQDSLFFLDFFVKAHQYNELP